MTEECYGRVAAACSADCSFTVKGKGSVAVAVVEPSYWRVSATSCCSRQVHFIRLGMETASACKPGR